MHTGADPSLSSASYLRAVKMATQENLLLRAPLVVAVEMMRATEPRRLQSANVSRGAVTTDGDVGADLRIRGLAPCSSAVLEPTNGFLVPFPFGTRMNLSMNGTTRAPPAFGNVDSGYGRSSGAAFGPALMAQRLAGATRRPGRRPTGAGARL